MVNLSSNIGNPVTVLGVGGFGCRIVRGMLGSPTARPLRLIAVDSDRQSLESTQLPENARMLVGIKLLEGRGCGGKPETGLSVLGAARSDLEKMLAGSAILLVVGGLGGGMLSGGASVIRSVAKKLEIPTMFIMTLPFMHEGGKRNRVAEEAFETDLREFADAVLCLPNDLLYSVLDPATPVEEAFRMADQEFVRTVLALSAVLRHGNLLAVDFNRFSMLLKRRKSHCSIGFGVVESSDISGRLEMAMERLLLSPLLGGPEQLAQADAVVFSLLGGPELSVGENKALLELVGRYVCSDAELIVGVSTGEEYRGRLQLTAVAIRYDLETGVSSHRSMQPSRTSPRNVNKPVPPKGNVTQLDFLASLDPPDKGIMEKTIPVKWNGQDLDIPTFKRHNIPINNGKLVGE